MPAKLVPYSNRVPPSGGDVPHSEETMPYFCFVSIRALPCVPNVANVSGLSILDSPFGFP